LYIVNILLSHIVDEEIALRCRRRRRRRIAAVFSIYTNNKSSATNKERLDVLL